MERRYNESRLNSEGGKIRGTASPTYDGTPGTEYELFPGVFERFAPGAFDQYLKNSPDVVALVNHDKSAILGRTSAGTLHLKTDAKGLHYEVDPPDTQYARDLLTSIQRGDIRGSSFAFHPTEVEWTRDGVKDVRLVRAATVHDVSPVTVPAYGGSSVGLRSAEERAAIEKERDEFHARLETEKRVSKLASLLK